MTDMQRMKNDISTMDKREVADKAIKDHREANDALTKERRLKADEKVDESRAKNDELTADRREEKDENINSVMALFVLALIVLATGTAFMLI